MNLKGMKKIIKLFFHLVVNIFYIVWLDPHHNLYPDEKYGGRKFFKPPQTCCNYGESELVRLQQENNKLREELCAYEDLFNKYN